MTTFHFSNDGSSDNSQNIINKYAKKHNNIKSFIQKNQGQAVARNFALKQATGKYITYVDSDDYIELDMLEKLFGTAISGDYDIVISDIIKEYENRSLIYRNYCNVKYEVNNNFMTSHLGPVARLYNRQFLINNNFMFLEGFIYEDLGSIPILGMYTDKICYVDEAYYHYAIRDGSVMNQLEYNKKIEDIFKVMEHLSEKITDDYKEELEYLYIEHLLYGASLRFLQFDKYDMLFNIKEIMHSNYINYNKNIYLKNKSIKFRIICFLSYHGMYKIIKILKRISGKNG